jgi:hypothetical protein
MSAWGDRVKTRRGRPASGQGETIYIPSRYLAAVKKILEQ